ncbi:MAG: two-component system, OmpR family, response regulator CssR [Thermoanaerobacteraceae bacterium]|nr:two-component system, OmpR family, response regulator CssR [Thermoanaerobacteraceae bacterium]RKL62254.1 DNA-binding response regulator [Thermoanaerobacteraceae bacterium SP2]
MNELIFVADDDPNILNILIKYVEKENFRARGFSSGLELEKAMEREKPDMVVLDIMMPGKDGLELCRTIRQKSNVPIIFISARGEEVDKIVGLELGADDYLSKPFSPRELVARIKSIFRRIHVKTDDKAETYTAGDVEMVPEERRCTANGKEMDLTAKEYDMLLCFVKNKNRAFNREELLSLVWGYDYFGDDRAVDDIVKRLRKKLRESGSILEIKTVWGFGYKVEG